MIRYLKDLVKRLKETLVILKELFDPIGKEFVQYKDIGVIASLLVFTRMVNANESLTNLKRNWLKVVSMLVPNERNTFTLEVIQKIYLEK